MASRSHAAGPLPGSGRRRPIPAPALPPPQSLARLLAVTLLTVAVVVIWSLRGDPAPPAVEPAPAISVVPADAPAPAEARISLPNATPPSQGPVVFSAAPAPPPALPRLHPHALPRPPEPADPHQPAEFIRFIAQPGDTLYDVSVVYGVSIEQLLRFNPGLGDGANIVVGQVIFIPEE